MASLTAVSFVVRRWLCAAHLALIAALSLLPAWMFPPSASGFPGIDKVVHAAMYGLLGALLRWAAGRESIPPAARWLPAAGVGYGLLMEVLQRGIGGTGRAFSWGDVLADLAGVAAGWIAAERLAGHGRRESA
ncbi:MAG: VanZ family protein [Kiritimatiellia bacterium]